MVVLLAMILGVGFLGSMGLAFVLVAIISALSGRPFPFSARKLGVAAFIGGALTFTGLGLLSDQLLFFLCAGGMLLGAIGLWPAVAMNERATSRPRPAEPQPDS